MVSNCSLAQQVEYAQEFQKLHPLANSLALGHVSVHQLACQLTRPYSVRFSSLEGRQRFSQLS